MLKPVKKIFEGEGTVVLVGGGTGGHIFPLLAVCEELLSVSAGLKLVYYGSGGELEEEVFGQAEIARRRIICGKLRRYFSPSALILNFIDFFRFAFGFFQSVVFLARDRPAVVFSKGGYVSLPVVWAAGVLRVPVVLHESDSTLGLANKLALPFARRIALAFPLANYPDKVQKKGFYAGVPLRRELVDIKKGDIRDEGFILVVGGSSGASSLNEQIFRLAPKILPKREIIHLTGAADFPRSLEFARHLDRKLAKNYQSFGFRRDLPLLLKRCSLVVSRSGATAIFETAACAKRAVFAPLSEKVAPHQLSNALLVKRSGWGEIHLPDDSPEALLKKIKGALELKGEAKIKELAFPASGELIARAILDETRRIKLGNLKKVHLIGSRGVSMRGLGKVLSQMGIAVSGSDLKLSGHSPKNIPADLDLVVYSAAASVRSPAEQEHRQAKRFSIPLIKRSEMIGLLMSAYTGISVAGTHGKTTIATLLARALEASGLAPSYLIGADDEPSAPSARLGHSSFFVAEACEYDRAFLDFPTTIGIIANVDREHLDYFKGGEKEIKAAFGDFAKSIYPGGALIFCADDKGASEVASSCRDGLSRRNIRLVSYGFKPSCDLTISNYRLVGERVRFTLKGGGREVHLESSQPGRHFALNCAASFAVANLCGVTTETFRRGVSAYRGARRRFSRVGEKNGVLVIDDYAHHPTEIKATLDALAELYPKRRKIVLFEPHQQSRFNLLFNDFVKAFANSSFDAALFLPVYKVAGRDVGEKVTSDDLAAELKKKKKVEVGHLKSYDDAVGFLRLFAKRGDVVLVMGATDVWKVAREYLRLVGS